jgi:hypothetical protein
VVVDGWTWSDGVRVPTAGYPVAWRSAILSDRGSIHFIRDRSMGASAYSRRLLPREADFLPRLDASYSRLGGGYQVRSGYPLIASVAVGPPVVLTRVCAVPLWLVVLVSGILPLWWAQKRRMYRRLSKQSRCPACGYDLRGSEGKACPECGADRTTMEPSGGPTRQ